MINGEGAENLHSGFQSVDDLFTIFGGGGFLAGWVREIEVLENLVMILLWN